MPDLPKLRPANLPTVDGTPSDRALFGEPSNEIGTVLCAYCNVDVHGKPAPYPGELLPFVDERKPTVIGALVSAVLAGAFLGMPLVILASVSLPRLPSQVQGMLTVLIVLAAAFAGFFLYRRANSRKAEVLFDYECVFFGADGAHRFIHPRYGSPHEQVIRYANANYMRYEDARITHPHGGESIELGVEFLDGSLLPIFSLGAVHAPNHPTRGAEAVKFVVGQALPMRVAQLEQRLVEGRTHELPVFGPKDLGGRYRSTHHGIDLRTDSLSLRPPHGRRRPGLA